MDGRVVINSRNNVINKGKALRIHIGNEYMARPGDHINIFDLNNNPTKYLIIDIDDDGSYLIIKEG
jgi:hypothetical protein